MVNDDLVYRQDVYCLIETAEVIGGTDNDSYISAPDLLDDVSNIPAADAVEVIRCRDCVHYLADIQDCGLYAWGKSNGLENPSPDDFCSRGVRRTDDGES